MILVYRSRSVTNAVSLTKPLLMPSRLWQNQPSSFPCKIKIIWAEDLATVASLLWDTGQVRSSVKFRSVYSRTRPSTRGLKDRQVTSFIIERVSLQSGTEYLAGGINANWQIHWHIFFFLLFYQYSVISCVPRIFEIFQELGTFVLWIKCHHTEVFAVCACRVNLFLSCSSLNLAWIILLSS